MSCRVVRVVLFFFVVEGVRGGCVEYEGIFIYICFFVLILFVY